MLKKKYSKKKTKNQQSTSMFRDSMNGNTKEVNATKQNQDQHVPQKVKILILFEFFPKFITSFQVTSKRCCTSQKQVKIHRKKSRIW